MKDDEVGKPGDQQPASAVAVGRLVQEEKISNVSGMSSFSGNLIVVFSPMLASFLFAAGGLPVILLVDLASFVFAFCVLLFFVSIPEGKPEKRDDSPFAGIAEGFAYLKKEKGILYMMLTMALGMVNACMGAGERTFTFACCLV